MTKTNKTTALLIAAVVIVGAVSFYGGMLYGQSKNSGRLGQFQNMSPQQRQAQMQQGGMRRNANGQGGNVSGEILNKDAQSLTVKLQNNGSKIILYSTSTTIGKMASGTADDLTVGENVIVSGSTNSDGSITAQSIQVRPATPGGPVPGQNPK